jgi:hypothetical protein
MRENKCFVSVQGGQVLVLKPQQRFTYKEAIEFAAWLVVMASCADPSKLETIDADFAAAKNEIEAGE